MEIPEGVVIVAKVAGFVVSAATGLVGINQWGTMRNRNKLKADLEILKLFDDIGTDPTRTANLKTRIERRLVRIYPPLDAPTTVLDKSDLFFGLLFLLGAFLLVPHTLSGNGSAQLFVSAAVVTLLFGGLLGVYKGFEQKIQALRKGNPQTAEEKG